MCDVIRLCFQLFVLPAATSTPLNEYQEMFNPIVELVQLKMP